MGPSPFFFNDSVLLFGPTCPPQNSAFRGSDFAKEIIKIESLPAFKEGKKI
jgi:hypothetical protein